LVLSFDAEIEEGDAESCSRHAGNLCVGFIEDPTGSGAHSTVIAPNRMTTRVQKVAGDGGTDEKSVVILVVTRFGNK